MKTRNRNYINLLGLVSLILLFSMSTVLQATEVKAEPEKYALDITLPLSLKEADDSILTDSFYQFKGYAGQGTLILTVYNVSDFQLYVNYQPVNTAAYRQNGTYRVDISGLTNNSQNVLQVTGVKGNDPKLQVQIPYPSIDMAKLYSEVLDKNIMTLFEDIVQAEIRQGSTGGQLVVLKDGRLVKNLAFGYVNSYYPDGTPIPLEQRVKVTNQTLFDLASNTKMYSVNYALQKLVADKKIAVSDLISKYFPEFKDEADAKIKGKDKLTIRELLEHQGGFPADPQYFNENYDKDDGIVNGKNDLFSQERSKTEEMILKTPLVYEPGSKTIYSDVDYMLLGLIVEKVSGKDLDTYMKDEFYRPLGLDRITFNPLQFGFRANEIAASELNGNSRDGVVTFSNNRVGTIQGTVHDEKAYYSMNGVSGHAGLFANALQLAQLAQVMLNEGGYGQYQFWDKTTQDLFVKPKDSNSTFGLGWRREGDGRYSWAFSPMADAATVGHTGWTGTLTVIDPKEQMVIVLLTNKKNSPVLNNKKNPNNFFGDRFLINRYGMAASLVYRALHPADMKQTKELLKELVEGKQRLIKEQPEIYKNRADEADLKALEKVQEVYKTK